MSRCVRLTVLAVFLSGCHSQPTAPAVTYTLDVPTSLVVPAPLAVDIEDDRPDWERHAYEGTFAFVPLESLQPSPLAHLMEDIEREAKGLEDPPSTVRLQLQSFRIVVSSEGPEPTTPGLYPLPGSSDNSPSSGWSNGKGAYQGGGINAVWELAFLVTFVGIYEAGLAGYDGIVYLAYSRRHHRSRPRGLREEYPPGVTCEIQVHATLEWQDDRKQEMDLRSVINPGERPLHADPNSCQEDLREAVQTACAQLASDWRAKILDPQALGQPVKPRREPAFTAYSGHP
jgi:hypothetical protein